MYLATDTRSGEQVAIKMSDASDLENLKHEIALQSLSVHENIVRYMETYQHQGRLWVRAGRRRVLLDACCGGRRPRARASLRMADARMLRVGGATLVCCVLVA